jgi:hypothetical protein
MFVGFGQQGKTMYDQFIDTAYLQCFHDGSILKKQVFQTWLPRRLLHNFNATGLFMV